VSERPSPEVPEAPLRRSDAGLAPAGPGWFVLNLADAAWRGARGWGRYSPLEPPGERFEQLGIGVHVLEPGERNGLYHGEEAQQDFLVLHGECLLLVEGRERALRQWDFVHAPRWTRHIFVGAGEGPCAILMVGARFPGRRLEYPVDPVALRHGAGVERATTSAREAYAGTPELTRRPYRPGDLGEAE
jgi:uncharacterized cupin superfamily protein